MGRIKIFTFFFFVSYFDHVNVYYYIILKLFIFHKDIKTFTYGVCTPITKDIFGDKLEEFRKITEVDEELIIKKRYVRKRWPEKREWLKKSETFLGLKRSNYRI